MPFMQGVHVSYIVDAHHTSTPIPPPPATLQNTRYGQLATSVSYTEGIIAVNE